jgi:hypothetical protein
VRCVLALIFCGNRINEVTTATLGPLPLDQLPKSKPVTPYAVFLIVPIWLTSAKLAASKVRRMYNTRNPGQLPDLGSSGLAWVWQKEAPVGAGGGRRRAHRGLTGRVGAGHFRPGLPRDEARFSSRPLGRNPPSGRPASNSKTPDRCWTVAQSDKFFFTFS